MVRPRRVLRRRYIDSAANTPAHPSTPTDFQERALSLGAASLAGDAHTPQTLFLLLLLLLLLFLSLSLFSISSSSNACVHASAHGRMRADVWAVYAGRRIQKCGERTSRLSVGHRIRFNFRAENGVDSYEPI